MPLSFDSLWPVLIAVTATVTLITFVAVSALFFIWLERKVAGRIQDRLGPTRVGQFGWLQTLADGLKLLTKEDHIPADADPILFRLGPYLAFIGSFLAFLALPFGKHLVALELNIAAFFILAVLATEVFGVILAGYSSGSKWSLFGAMREAAQMVSYEVPRAISVVIPVVLAGSLNLQTIVEKQTGFFWNWFVFHDPFTFLAFWIFFVTGIASCKRAPFDLAEAESELVAGFHTEYSGLRWSFFFMAEYGSMFIMSALAVLLFLGGWNTGLLPRDLVDLLGPAADLLNALVLVGKAWILVFVMMWTRWSLPRLRIDQVMTTCLQYLVPISCVLLIGASLTPLIWNSLGITWRIRQPAIVAPVAPATPAPISPTSLPEASRPTI